MATSIYDFLVAHLDIHVTGPAFPHRDEPLQCYIPMHRSYQRGDSAPQHGTTSAEATQTSRRPLPGVHQHRDALNRPLMMYGSPRSIPCSSNDGAEAIVYDKDEKALEAAIGEEVLDLAIESWLEARGSDSLSSIETLQAFGSFVSSLGTQPVTIPLRDLVLDMIDSYQNVVQTIEPFTWATPDKQFAAHTNAGPEAWLTLVLEEFVRSQEVFFFPEGRQPVMEIAFSVKKWRVDGVELEFYVSWNPVLVMFDGLSNTVEEGRDFYMKPIFKEPCNLPPGENGMHAVPTTSSFTLSIPNEGWLQWMHWDDIRGCLVGQAPEILAGICGAQKNDAYTIALAFEGRLVKHFPNKTKLEKCVRVAVPLTIRRAPSKCGMSGELTSSPRVQGGPMRTWTGSRRARGIRSLGRSQLFKRAQSSTQDSGRPQNLVQKENRNLTTEEIFKLMQRKATETNDLATSPTRLDNPLFLARFHDAVGLSYPLPALRNVEVRAVHGHVPAPAPSSPAKDDRVSAQRDPVVCGLTLDDLSPRPRRREAKDDACVQVYEDEQADVLSTPSQQKEAAGPCTDDLDGGEALSAGSKTPSARLTLAAISSNRKGKEAVVNENVGSRKSLYHGPVTKDDMPRPENQESTLEAQMSSIEERLAKQHRLYADQLRRAKRFGRRIDEEAIFGDGSCVDDANPRDHGAQDAQAKLVESEVENAERLEAIRSDELAALAAQVMKYKEEGSRGRSGGLNFLSGLGADALGIDAEQWQQMIQANHAELNEQGKKRAESDGGGEERVKLDTTMMDAVDSDEAELEGFSSDEQDGDGDEVVRVPMGL